ncbi:MAG TPA: efflux RND transporter periplasmic adaptor subunit, partial [Candidatus Eisenbacteria bacterium]|nr:efflux RND transporter periplasmic adaptor subunit [Candidatus Eisenbacteria bacterium]
MTNGKRKGLLPLSRGRAIGIAAGVLALVLVVVLAGRGKKKVETAIPTMAVERRDITVTVEANGAIEPINVVEVKSKASGQIMDMPVEIGSVVRSGQLLAQVDPRDVRNQYNQSRAALQAAQVQSEVTGSQKRRSDQLFTEGVITAQEHETAVLAAENAKSSLVRARTDLDIARQRLEDATVRAPVGGTIIGKPVSVGQVISSATSSVSGGTTLLTMADLYRIRLRALVNETDIGNVKPGQPANVIVDAYPDRQFRGQIEKVEPMALVEQSVTMFPVLVSLSNEEGLLMPGMNGEVTVMVEEQNDVLAVPVDAVRNAREAADAGEALGLSADEVRTALRTQAQTRMAQGGGPGGGGTGSGTGGGTGTVTASEGRRGTARAAERDTVAAGREPRTGRQDWRNASPAERDSMRARRARAGGGEGGFGGARQSGSGTGAGGPGAGSAGGTQGRSGGGQRRVVFVKKGDTFEPRSVRLGVSNYEYA